MLVKTTSRQTGPPVPQSDVDEPATTSSQTPSSDGQTSPRNGVIPSKIPHPSSLPYLHTSGTKISGTYLPCHHSAIRYVSRMRRRMYRVILPKRWSDSGGVDKDDVVWREDMEDLVTERMRDEVLGLLAYVAGKGKGYIVGCAGGYEDVGRSKQVGAVIWTGPGEHRGNDDSRTVEAADSSQPASGAQEQVQVQEQQVQQQQPDPTKPTAKSPAQTNPPSTNIHIPPPYAMRPYKGGAHIPIYNLQTLLGADKVHRLRAEQPVFEHEVLVIKSKRMTTELQMAMWRLMGFLAD